MTAKAKTASNAKPKESRSERARKKIEQFPDLVPHWVVAEKLGITTDSLRDWVAGGNFPEPHSVCVQTWFYRVDLVRAYLETGRWPEGTKFRRQDRGQ